MAIHFVAARAFALLKKEIFRITRRSAQPIFSQRWSCILRRSKIPRVPFSFGFCRIFVDWPVAQISLLRLDPARGSSQRNARHGLRSRPRNGLSISHGGIWRGGSLLRRLPSRKWNARHGASPTLDTRSPRKISVTGCRDK